MYDNLQDSTINRLLAIQKYLREKTTPDCYVKQNEIAEYLLEEYGWNVKRQTISEYLDLLSREPYAFGLKCYRMKGNIKKYKYLGIFSEEQLSLIADIICSSTFLDNKTAKGLLDNIKSFITDNKKDEFPDIESYIRPHMLNSECLKNIKAIHIAINTNRKIQFNYADMNADKQLFYYNKFGDNQIIKKYVYYNSQKQITTKVEIINPDDINQEKVGFTKTASPYKLMWNDSRCYLVAGLHIATGEFKIVTFRVDRMFEIKICGGDISDDEGVLKKHLRDFPANSEFFNKETHAFMAEQFLKSSFNMFNSESGQTIKTTFRVADRLAKTIVDRFGYDIRFSKSEEGYFTFSSEILPSKPFFAWLSQFRYNEISLVRPKEIVEAYKVFLRDIIEDYENQ